MIANPSGRTPVGLNLAIADGSSPVIARVDAQSILPPRYLKRAVETLQRTGAANVGGIQRPVGDNGLQRVIAVGMCSPFGAGPAQFRRDGYEGPTDTVYLGSVPPEVLERVGAFDETLDRNQDYELNWRLRGAGEQVWLDPALSVVYRPRATFGQLASQYFRTARKRHVLLRNPRSLRPRQTVARCSSSASSCRRWSCSGVAVADCWCRRLTRERRCWWPVTRGQISLARPIATC
ncbi:MAG: hypothetical protein R2695_03390 [Acidimicrobiales bacterium]